MNDLETRQLRYFVAVAEEQHFGRAAQRLGMAQPPLSRAIREMERQLGVQLLVRTTRQVALTPVGETLLDDARRALEAVQAAGRRAHRSGRPAPALTVALKADFDAGLLPRIVEEYRELPVQLLLGGPGDQVRAVRDGRADVALVPTPYDPQGLESEPLVTAPRVVALAASDPLVTHPGPLRLSDLAGRMLPNGTAAELGDVTAPTGQRVRRDLSQIFSLVETGNLVWFLPQWLAERFPRPNLVYRAVEDLEPSTLAVVWAVGSRSPAVAAFVRTAQDVASR
ncbi:LysR family transcriptional regulator [Kineosporia succinea]|uniref:DNA-binding transcriptional LysR family regulator n=1 Tax=Kineosporia succinea TaxID=84632 RepID=A0ABT9PGC4_9ACTN|nr:LysR family transcriptional regulator [Kineosporia succinea]MDP9831195.1 DNA-binding transcriptional LysR family regulator [Kineosporia succinea]